MPTDNTLKERILEWKARRHAVILSHNYTTADVQDIADFVGDSLELSRKAAECKAEVIVFCGVRFMAETAKILSPGSLVLHPVADAGCPMADMVTPEPLRQYKAEHPDTLIVAYVNTTAATKTAVDICCTSGNAERLIAAIPADQKILFVPDGNLGRNVSAALNRKMEFWPGYCPIHNALTVDMITRARQAHPGAKVVVHPECQPAVVAAADASLSTGGMLSYVRQSDAAEFIMGTESGIIHRLEKENPGKKFHPIAPEPICHDMKKIRLEDILNALETLSPVIELDSDTLTQALAPIQRMLACK